MKKPDHSREDEVLNILRIVRQGCEKSFEEGKEHRTPSKETNMRLESIEKTLAKIEEADRNFVGKDLFWKVVTGFAAVIVMIFAYINNTTQDRFTSRDGERLEAEIIALKEDNRSFTSNLGDINTSIAIIKNDMKTIVKFIENNEFISE